MSGALLGGGTGGVAAGVGVGFALAFVSPLLMAAAGGVVVGGAAMSGIALAVARSNQKKLRAVQAEVEGILDQLEAGEELEPPPPSWRDWVQRQFHGARKVLDDLDSDMGGKTKR